jgi:hypothetical protein
MPQAKYKFAAASPILAVLLGKLESGPALKYQKISTAAEFNRGALYKFLMGET